MIITLPQAIPDSSKKIQKVVRSMLKRTAYREYRKKIPGYVADIQRGEAHYQPCVFIVPYWAYNPTHPKNLSSQGGYFIYYVAHELSHMIAFKKHGVRCGHDARFLEIFEAICPKEYQHFEVAYQTSGTYNDSK